MSFCATFAYSVRECAVSPFRPEVSTAPTTRGVGSRTGFVSPPGGRPTTKPAAAHRDARSGGMLPNGQRCVRIEVKVFARVKGPERTTVHRWWRTVARERRDWGGIGW